MYMDLAFVSFSFALPFRIHCHCASSIVLVLELRQLHIVGRKAIFFNGVALETSFDRKSMLASRFVLSQ